MALVKKVRKLGARGAGGGVTRETSSARPVFVEKEPPCSHACPCGTDVRGFLTAMARGAERGLTEAQAVEAAFYIIAERNPLPAVVGRLCPHHCETGCTREPYDGGVSVNQIERAIAEAAVNAAWPLRRMAPTASPADVTVIGAGAAGLSAAYQLARRGHRVVLVDTHALPGGELRYGVEPERVPRAVLDAEIERILQLGVKFGGSADVSALEASGEGRLIRTRVYEDGTPVAFGGLAAAVHFGRHAAELLDAELRGVAIEPAPALPPVDKGRIVLDHYPKAPRVAGGDEAWTPGTAMLEAQRCLACGGCFECDNCWKYCPDQAVIKPLQKGDPYRFKLEFCQGCNKCAEQCPTNYIEMR
jgi:Pyruvate/2-oxoacid:ferredoxin oxidoreductase delta subunit